MEDFGEKLFIGFLVMVFAISTGISLWIAFGNGAAYVEQWGVSTQVAESTALEDDVTAVEVIEVSEPTEVVEVSEPAEVAVKTRMATSSVVSICAVFIALIVAGTVLILVWMKNKREAERDEMSYKMYRKDVEYIDNTNALMKKYL